MNDNFFKNEFEKLVDWVLTSDALPVEVKKKADSRSSRGIC